VDTWGRSFFVNKSIFNKTLFAAETAMSTPAKIDNMREAKVNGYYVHLIYVTTQDPEINVGRVLDRMKLLYC